MNFISRCLQSAKSDLNFGLNEVYYKVLWQLLQIIYYEKRLLRRDSCFVISATVLLRSVTNVTALSTSSPSISRKVCVGYFQKLLQMPHSGLQ